MADDAITRLADLLPNTVPGEWLPGPGNNDGTVRVLQPWGPQVVAACGGSEATAEFIALAHNALPALVPILTAAVAFAHRLEQHPAHDAKERKALAMAVLQAVRAYEGGKSGGPGA